MTEKGARFSVGAAAYMGWLAARNWVRRNLEIDADVHYQAGGSDNRIILSAARSRNGQTEKYEHDFLKDMLGSLLLPPQTFPSLHGHSFVLTSLALPSPEYLYFFGVALMSSSLSRGNWPKGEKPGGLDEDFRVSRAILVDDLHKDVGLPLDEEPLRRLSWWVVFPPYGWHQNDGQSYNLMTLIDQIFHKKLVTRERAEDYLRALLTSQIYHFRLLAARTLMLLRLPPKTPQETLFYHHALNAGDFPAASGAMARLAWGMEGRDADTPIPAEWATEQQSVWRRLLENAPEDPWRKSPILYDPLYIEMGALKPEEGARRQQALENMLLKEPDNWFLKTAYGTALMEGPEPGLGEKMLVEAMAKHPGCATAHLSLGTMLKRQGRRDEAMAVFHEAVRLWPWDHQTVDSCLWTLTDGMTQFA